LEQVTNWIFIKAPFTMKTLVSTARDGALLTGVRVNTLINLHRATIDLGLDKSFLNFRRSNVTE